LTINRLPEKAADLASDRRAGGVRDKLAFDMRGEWFSVHPLPTAARKTGSDSVYGLPPQIVNQIKTMLFNGQHHAFNITLSRHGLFSTPVLWYRLFYLSGRKGYPNSMPTQRNSVRPVFAKMTA
jgi:hypothetical protein